MRDERVALCVGIFVGGKSSRMHGRAKGLLAAPDSGETLVERWSRVCSEALPGARVWLVGRHPEYQRFGLGFIDDTPAEVGPLGGLRGLLVQAGKDGADAIALACDMPHATAALLTRLAHHEPGASAVAPRIDGKWQPLFARYRPGRVLPVSDRLLASQRMGLWQIFTELGDAQTLPLTTEEEPLLADWDTEADVASVR